MDEMLNHQEVARECSWDTPQVNLLRNIPEGGA